MTSVGKRTRGQEYLSGMLVYHPFPISPFHVNRQKRVQIVRLHAERNHSPVIPLSTRCQFDSHPQAESWQKMNWNRR